MAIITGGGGRVNEFLRDKKAKIKPVQYSQKHNEKTVKIVESFSRFFLKKTLHFTGTSCIIATVVTLIAMKREVAAHEAGFPWSECQVRKLATSHCTK